VRNNLKRGRKKRGMAVTRLLTIITSPALIGKGERERRKGEREGRG